MIKQLQQLAVVEETCRQPRKTNCGLKSNTEAIWIIADKDRVVFSRIVPPEANIV